MSQSPAVSVPRLVLDTHVWLDWLVFDDPGVARIRKAVDTGAVDVYIDAVCEEELVRVMARGFARRSVPAQAQAVALATCRRVAKRIDSAASEAARAGLPRCGDPDDQKFLEAALAANAQFLITKDRKLLALARKTGVPFRIVTPGKLASE